MLPWHIFYCEKIFPGPHLPKKKQTEKNQIEFTLCDQLTKVDSDPRWIMSDTWRTHFFRPPPSLSASADWLPVTEYCWRTPFHLPESCCWVQRIKLSRLYQTVSGAAYTKDVMTSENVKLKMKWTDWNIILGNLLIKVKIDPVVCIINTSLLSKINK